MARKELSIDIQIQRQQEVVDKAKAKYDAALADLNSLLEKKDELKKQELIKAIENSNLSYDDIMNYLSGANNNSSDNTSNESSDSTEE